MAITPTPRDAPASARLAASTAGAQLQVGRHSVGELLEAQPRFATARSTAGALTLLPANSSATAYVRTPTGGAVVDGLARLAAAVEQRDGRPLDLDGIALSTSDAQRKAAYVAGSIANGNLAVPPKRAMASDDWLDDATDVLADADAGHFSDYGSRWVTIDAGTTRALRGIAAGTHTSSGREARDSTMMVWHELEHAASPISVAASNRLGDLEEGIASTLTNWPGTAAAAAGATGWKIDARGPTPTYGKETAAVRAMLRLAGVDTRRTGDVTRAVDLLQSGSVTRVPGRLADAIVGAQELAPSAREPLRQRIAVGGADPTQVEHLLDGLTT